MVGIFNFHQIYRDIQLNNEDFELNLEDYDVDDLDD